MPSSSRSRPASDLLRIDTPAAGDIEGEGFRAPCQNFLETQVATLALRVRF